MAFSGIPLPRTVYDVEKGGPIITGMQGANALTKSNLDNAHQSLVNQYYAPNIQSEINNRNALTKGYEIANQYSPERLQLANTYQALQNKYYAPNIQSEIGLRGQQSRLAGSESDKINYLLSHPGLMGDETSKQIQSLIDMGLIDKNSLSGNFNKNSNQIYGSNINQPQQSYTPIGGGNSVTQPPSSNFGSNVTPFKTGNAMLDTILNKPYAEMAYRQQMTKGYNWSHLPVETKNQLVAQGYGMGIDPIKMMGYINQGMGLQDIAKSEGLDPDNLPPPIYSPTTATKTRVQQVEQVGRELDYLSSASTPIIKKYADTFMGISPARISDMLSNNPDAQKRFGEYIGALSVQTGLANGRTLLEGGRPGVEVMRMVKDSALKGIDQNSPIKMSGIAYEAAQNKIDEILQKGAKIRTTTGMNPMSEIGKSHGKSTEGNESSNKKVIKIVRDAHGKLVRE